MKYCNSLKSALISDGSHPVSPERRMTCLEKDQSVGVLMFPSLASDQHSSFILKFTGEPEMVTISVCATSHVRYMTLFNRLATET